MRGSYHLMHQLYNQETTSETPEAQRVIVSLTTIPERIEKGVIQMSLFSLLKQTKLPHKIYINIPLETKKGAKYPIALLEKSLNDLKSNLIHINIVPRDLGPITKILPILPLVRDDDFLVLVDDDVTYDSSMIENLIHSGRPAVGFAGRKDGLKYVTGLTFQGEVEFLETFAGVMYKALLMKGLAAYVESFHGLCHDQDDILIGKYLKEKNISPFVMKCQRFAQHNAQGTAELRHKNLKEENRKCYGQLWNI